MNWNLTDIFKGREEFENAKKEFLKNLDIIESYKTKLCDSSENLYNCYQTIEKALEQFEKLYAYGMLTYHLDMANQEGIKLFKEVENLQSLYNTKTAFITPEITYVDENKVKQYLEEPRLEPYKRDIQDILDEKKHTLSKESEELLANYSEIFSASENTFDTLTNAEFKFGTIINENGEEVELTDSNYIIFLKSKSKKVRKQAFEKMYGKYSEYINTLTELYLSNAKKYAITSSLRKYESSIERAVKNDDSSVKLYNALIKTLNENMEANYKFMKLKKKLLKNKGLANDKMHMYDLYVNPFEEKNDEITFEQAKQEVLNALNVLGSEYNELLITAFNNNWIDSKPMPNKKGGAYSMGVYGIHPFVLMSFVNSKRDVSTIAHELGHSIHSYYSNKNQNIINANYTIMVAEVASTVNELLLSHYQIENEKDNKKKAELLYELLEMIRATLYRQSMFAEFEKDIHEKIEKGEFLSSEDLNETYYRLNQKYFGTDIEIDSKIQYEWARIPHFYSDFYVYKYATGISAAICIVKNILEKGETYINSYIEMLKQGCSRKSIELLKMVDVDLESEQTYKRAVDFYEEKINKLENLMNLKKD